MLKSVEARMPGKESPISHFGIFNLKHFLSNASELDSYYDECIHSLEFLWQKFTNKAAIVFDKKSGKMRCTKLNIFNSKDSLNSLKNDFYSVLEVLRQLSVKVTTIKRFTQANAYREVLRKQTEDYPTVCCLIRAMVAHATNSCLPETIFSTQKFLKSKIRNRMSVTLLNDIIHLRKNPIGLNDINYEDVHADVLRESRKVHNALEGLQEEMNDLEAGVEHL